MEDNKLQQTEEIEALCAIYGKEWSQEGGSENYKIQIARDVSLFINFIKEYPSEKAPDYQLLAPGLSADVKKLVHDNFKQIYLENQGGPVVFQWIEKLKEICPQSSVEVKVAATSEIEAKCENPTTFDIIHGPILRDRKSTFQGHACKAFSQKDIGGIMDQLMQNKKIAQATHNILAYRIQQTNGALLQDSDDDGETHAGGRLLHLLQVMNLTNVVVVVSRWFGGILLGPDRFRHINNAARQVLQEGKFV